MDYFIQVGLSALLWRNLRLSYPLGKAVAFVCPLLTRDPMVYSCVWAVYKVFHGGYQLQVPTFHCTENPFPSPICRTYLSHLLLIVVCTGFYAEMFWDSFLCNYMYIYVRVYINTCKYTHIYMCFHTLINDDWMIHCSGFVPLPILFLEYWDLCEKRLSWETSLWVEVKHLLRVYMQKYKKQYLVTRTFTYVEQQKQSFSSVQNLYLKGKYSTLFSIVQGLYRQNNK